MDGQGTECRRNIAENLNHLSIGARALQTTDRQTDIIIMGRFIVRLFYMENIGLGALQLSLTVGNSNQLECGTMPNVMAALPIIGGALCSTPQSLAGAHCSNVVH